MPQPISGVTGDTLNAGDEDGLYGDSQDTDEVTDVSQEPEPPPEAPRLPFDAMRNEPLLTNVLIANYDGDTDERGFLHGFGTAYFQGGNEYTGEFVNGLMHGKGKYVWSDKTVYEGDFFENQVCGNGVYIWPDGSIYNGEVRDGLRHGEGTFKCSSIPCTYSGSWSYSKREGQGCLKYDADGVSYYEGSWCENQRHGYGTRRYASGNVYQGDWKNNVRHGQGTMNWYNTNQKYTGQWLNGVQHGYGEHTWFLRRVKGSQYPLRNQYVGDLVNGMRHGKGIFYYANGARYDGDWVNNMKHGEGTFVFKNGMVFKGLFESDHMLEFPGMNLSGMITPDITHAGLPVRPGTPIAASTILSGDWTTGLDLSLVHLFDGRDIDLDQRETETQQVNYVLLQHISKLKEIYTFYSAIGNDTSLDNTSAMTKMQFCRFLKDCHVHHYNVSLPQILRLIDQDDNSNQPHDPWVNILMRDFLTALVTIAYHIFSDQELPDNQLMLPWCVSQLVTQNILSHPCTVGGFVYSKTNITLELTQYFQKIYAVFQHWIQPQKNSQTKHTLNMRQFLWMLQEYKLINKELSAQEVIKILADNDPRVIQDEFINLEIEISFLEFLEAIVMCGMVYAKDGVLIDSLTPRQSALGSYSHSQSGRSHVSTVTMQAIESPDIDSRVSSHSVLAPNDKQDGEQSPSGDQAASPTKEIPLLILQVSSTDEPKPILIENQLSGSAETWNDQEVNQISEEQQDEVQANDNHDGEDNTNENAVLEDDFSLKMNYFFNKKFFPAAERQQLLENKLKFKITV